MLTLLQNHSHAIDWPSFMEARLADVEDGRLRRFFQAGVCDPDTEVGGAPLVALDLETTGLNPGRDDIVSIGLVPFSLAGIRCGDARYWLLKPRRSLEDSAVFHGITHSDIKRAPDLERIFEDILEILASKVVVAHCLQIERNFIYNAFMQRLGEGVCFPIIDTMAIEAEKRQQGLSLWDRLLRRSDVSVRLGDARQRYGLPLYQSHHALTDALATAELFLAQMSHHYPGGVPVKALWR